jgi:aerobic-type carbon monoxide dehydrogenase small subunit (CoxS/CutS family)
LASYTGAKHLCDRGVCGLCTTLAVEFEGKSIQTVEGIAADPNWMPLIDACCKWDAMQCGSCAPGFLVSSKNLLDKNPKLTEDDCIQALDGNICCCGAYLRHPTSILESSSQIMRGA